MKRYKVTLEADGPDEGDALGGPSRRADEDVDAIGPDLARQYMEIFRFTR